MTQHHLDGSFIDEMMRHGSRVRGYWWIILVMLLNTWVGWLTYARFPSTVRREPKNNFTLAFA